MRFITVFAIAVFAVVLSMAQAQNYQQLFAGFGPYANYRPPVVMRDPRSNTGPVLFPPGPPSNPAETSGVVVGASGYGFVPPNAAFFAYFY